MKQDELELAYLAGVMDGDGSFGINKLKTKRNPLYFPVLQCRTWRTFIYALQKRFGGTIAITKPHICIDGSEGHSLLNWKLRSQDNVKPALEALIPYLQIKKERAKFLLNFIFDNPFSRGHILSNRDIENRERSYLKMIQFNEWKACHGTISTEVAKEMSEEPKFWSYIAGMMDTDGSFALKRQVQNKGTDVVNARYLPVISLSMTDIRAINYLRKNCNVGKLYTPKNKSTNAGFHYQFGIYTKNESREFLKRVIPFLKSKTEQAQLLLDFCNKSENTKYCKGGISEKELTFREDCYQKMIQLNKYGVYKPSLIGLEAQNWATRRKQQIACSVND